MLRKNYRVSALFKILIVIVSGYGLYLNSGLPEKFSKEMFLYFTILSNLLCFLYFIYATFFTLKYKESKTLKISIKGSVTMAITVTMLIYWGVLVPAGFVMGDSKRLADYTVHLIVPLLVILDYLLFDQKGLMTKKDPLYWLSIPLLYYVFTLIAYIFDIRYFDNNRFPYFFIDHTIVGATNVVINVLVLLVFFSLLGYLIYFIDHKLAKKNTQ